jgi:hypothetical protein
LAVFDHACGLRSLKGEFQGIVAANVKHLAVIPAFSHIDWRLHECLERLNLPILHLHGCSDLPQARSFLLSQALESDATSFLLVDADMVPTPEQVELLLSSPRLGEGSAVTGAYLNKHRAFAFQPKDRTRTLKLHGSPRFVECVGAGLGLAAVHRASLERLRAQLPELLDKGSRWYPFCMPRTLSDPQVTGGRTVYLSEDYGFWHDLRTLGRTELWLDTHVAVSHLVTAPLVIEEGMEVDPR